MGGRDLARHARRVLGVVVLHPHAVTAGHHHRRVGGTRLRALLDDDPGLGPRPEARHHARSVANLHGPAGEVRVLAGQRGDAGGDAAVSGQRLVHEGEAVVNHLATRPVRDRRHAGLAGLGGPPLIWQPMLEFAAANTPMKTISRAARIMPITQPRTLRNLVHSARRSPPKPVPRGLSPVVAPGWGCAVVCVVIARPPRPRRHRSLLDGTRPRPWSAPCTPVPAWPGARTPRRTAW